MEALSVRAWGANSQTPVEGKLPIYALWPIATDAVYRSLPLFGDAFPEQVEVEVVPAFTRQRPLSAAALVCNVLGPGSSEPILSPAYPVSFTDCLAGAAVDIWSARSDGREELARFEVSLTGGECGYRLSVPLPTLRHVRPLLEEAYAVGEPLMQRPVVVFDGKAFDAAEQYYSTRTDGEAMSAVHGTVHYCPELGVVWLHVMSFLPLEEEKSSANQVLVSPAALGPVVAAQKNFEFLGLVHNHLISQPEALRTPVPSAVDVLTMRRVLYRSHQLSLTVNVGVFAAGEQVPLAYYHLAWRKGTIITTAGFAVHKPARVHVPARINPTNGEESR